MDEEKKKMEAKMEMKFGDVEGLTNSRTTNLEA